MRKYVFIIINLFAGCFYSTAQTFVVDTLVYSGNPANRINVLIMGDGYTAAQQSQFRTNALTMANSLLNTPPFNLYQNFFNVIAIEVISGQSGNDHVGNSSDNDCGTQPVVSVNNYLQSGFDGGGSGGEVHRCIYSNQLSLIYSIANTNFPQYDYINVLANTTYYGGCAGGVAFTSLHPASNDIFVHEFGHSFGDLSDEYDYGGSGCSSGTTQYINVSQQTDTSLLVWKKWLTTAPIPTPNGTNCTLIGLYQGAQYCSTGWYRPKCNCKMRSSNQPFCEVCKEQFIYRISELVNYIEGYTPQNLAPTICRNTPQQFTVTVLNSSNNTVRTRWFVDNVLVANNSLSYTFDPTGYSNGTHEIKAIAYDTTAIAKKTLIPHQVAWTVVLSSQLSLTPSQTNVNCAGGNNGSATVVATGGYTPYTYLWSTGGTTASVTNLTAGNYTVTVTEPGYSSVVNSPLCTPATGSYCCSIGIYNVTFNTINKTTTHGSEGYRNFDSVRTTVDAGLTYGLSVTTGPTYDERVRAWIDYNKNGVFETTEQVMSSQNTLPNRVHLSNVTIPAASALGALRMRVGSDYEGQSYPSPCTNVVYGQFEDYTVYVRGGTGCSKTASFNITQPQPFSLIASVTHVSCAGDNSGAIDITPLGGTPNYTYNWGGGITTEDRTNLANGTYGVTGTDSKGCVATQSATVNPFVPGPNGGAGTWTWTGLQSTSWFQPCNWDKQSLPDNFSDVVIPGGTALNPIITGAAATCNTITINRTNGAKVDVNVTGGGSLVISQ